MSYHVGGGRSRHRAAGRIKVVIKEGTGDFCGRRKRRTLRVKDFLEVVSEELGFESLHR